jgi:hypothetical protein
MPFFAVAQLDLDVPPEVAFDTLADYPTWKDWMPRSFVVASPADTPHHLGKRFAIKVAGLPFASSIQVTAMERPRVLAWSGGMRGVLRGHHEFRFESNGKGGTTVHSREKWSGVLAPLLRPGLKPAAEKIGREQLAGLAAACRAKGSR